MNIVVRSPNWIGDQILALPFFFGLRSQFPDARIFSICTPWVRSLQFKGLVDEVIEIRKARGIFSESKRLAHEVGRRTGGREIDLAISLPDSFSAAFIQWRLGARIRVGYRAEARGMLLTHSLNEADLETPGYSQKKQLQVHRAKKYLALLNPVKKLFPGRETIDPELSFFDQEEWTPKGWQKNRGLFSQFDAEKYLGKIKFDAANFKTPYYVIAPGATAESRTWPIEYFIELCRLINDAWGFRGVVVGGPKEAHLGERLAGLAELNVVDYTSRGPVDELIPIFRNALFAVTNESGLCHVASLSGALTHIVCGAADPVRTSPIGPGPIRVHFNAIPCWPCERNHCALPIENKNACLKGIMPEAVFARIGEDLRERNVL